MSVDHSRMACLNTTFSVQINNEKNYWVKVLERVLAVVKFLSKRGKPFRGHSEILGRKDNGNYLGTLELLAEFDPFLAEHIEKYGGKGRGTVNYLSSTICDEFIEILVSRVTNYILGEIKVAKYYSVCIDSTPDISHVDQLSMVLRYVRCDGNPVERFLGFISIEKHDGLYSRGPGPRPRGQAKRYGFFGHL